MGKKRAVAYVRVSSESKAQLHSYEFQEQYWKSKFEQDPDNELIHIYADRGISGSSVSKRPQFLIMMQDARDGKFDVIHTKSVSRFARNTVQLLEAVRELRDLGIEVVFEKEQISTMKPTSELFLTIAATIAENDLQVDSERQKWSFQRRFESGWYSIGNGMYGYRMTGNNTLVIVPEEAEIVRWIYNMYISGSGCPAIAKSLNDAGIPNGKGKQWRANSILKMIDNEKYMGDVLSGKSVRIDGIKHDNTEGAYGDIFYIENAHEGIISKETFAKVQELRRQRKNTKLAKHTTPHYPFTGMMVCGCCGSYFRHKVNNSGKAWQTEIWSCAQKGNAGAASCESTQIKDTVLRDKFIEAYNEFITTRPQGESVEAIQTVIQHLYEQEQRLATLMLRKLISDKDFRFEQQAIKAQIREQQERIHELQRSIVKESEFTPITEFDEHKLQTFITQIIMRRNTVTFRFYNGVEITKEYTNGQAGNKVGWKKKQEAAQ